MSSYEGMEADANLWRVLLSNGEVRSMSLEALDAVYQAGVIDESTPLLAPNATVWTKLGVAAGIDDTDSEPTGKTRVLSTALMGALSGAVTVVAPAVAPSAKVAPRNVAAKIDDPAFDPPDTTRIMQMVVNVAAADFATRTSPVTMSAPANQKGTGRIVVALGVALISLVAFAQSASYASARVAAQKASAASALGVAQPVSMSEALPVREAPAAPPVAVASEKPNDAYAKIVAPMVAEKSAERASDTREVQKPKARVVATSPKAPQAAAVVDHTPRRHGRWSVQSGPSTTTSGPTGRSPFVNSAQRFDPMNAKL